MPANQLPKRRDFLRTAAAGAAGAVGMSALGFDKVFAQSTGGWVAGMQINPAIDNKRVICCHDTKMLTATPVNTSFASQNAAVDANLVSANLDQMAMMLTNKTAAADAWSAIFRSSKPWASTRVAIKTNAILGANGNHPRVAVIKKICDVFVDQLKVPAANIVLYDANSDASSCYSTYCSLTDATKIRAVASVRAQSLGGTVPVTIASATKTMIGVADLVNGAVDILVNIAIVKRHSGPGTAYAYGSCSLCMKNHLGTFINSGTENNPSATGLHNIDAICDINKQPAVVGGDPVRQQLCIVDGLLANGNGAGGSFDTRVDRLVMGTFAPIVDYLTAMRIMKDVMNKPDANNNLPKFLTNFGYAETDALDWNEYVPGSGTVISTGGSSGTGGGGSSGTGGAGSGGVKATGGVGSGGANATGGADSGGVKATGGVGSGGASPTGGAGSGTITATGGAAASGGTPSTGGSVSATGGAAGSSSSGLATGGSTNVTGSSSGGCSVAGADRSATRWGAMLALGAAVAGKLRRLVGGDDRS